MAAPKKYSQDRLWNLMMVRNGVKGDDFNELFSQLTCSAALSAPATFQRAGVPGPPCLATKISAAFLRIQPGIFVLSFCSAMTM